MLLAALCAWPLATLASVPRSGSISPAPTRAAAFDAAFQEVVGPASLAATNIAYDANLQRLGALVPQGDRAREARFRSVYCGSRTWKDPALGLAYSDEALAWARELRDVASQARATLCRAHYIMLTRGSQHGLPEIDKAIALLTNGQEQQLLAESLEIRGDAKSLIGEQATAMLDFQQARAAYRAAGINTEVEPLMLSIAVAYRRIGDFAQAERYFTQAVARMQDRQDWEGVATNLIQLGFLHDESGVPEKAEKVFKQAIEIGRTYKDPYSVSAAQLGLAEIQIQLGDPVAALGTLAQARAGFAAEQDESSEDMLLMLTGEAFARQNRHADALLRYRQALPLIQRNGNDRYLAQLYRDRAASNEALGRTGDALEDYKRYNALQMKLQARMRLQQSRLLEYEYEIRRRDFENQKLRVDADAQQRQLTVMERVRRWQTLALVLGALLVALLASLAWRQWNRSRQLRNQTMTDSLTSVASRIGIEHEIEQAIAQATRTGSPLSLLMLDLDHFKSINDRFGHAIGDRFLRDAATTWHAQLRGRDPLGRIGGEEFVVVCQDTSLEQALLVAARLRESLHALRFDDIDRSLRISVSIGAASYNKGETREELLASADGALYRAKHRGRDRIET
ncbi:MAG: diguanylate cyclase [Pseudomonadota bacterium]|nr:diguanylate cyclase [Pseudomonadota bacterium]